MKQYILSLNSGSSSLKFNLFERDNENILRSHLSGIVQEVGNEEKSRLRYDIGGCRHQKDIPVRTHNEALILLFRELEKQRSHGVHMQRGSQSGSWRRKV